MAYGIRLHVWGERACFTRPEMKVERVCYDVPTPSAARGILEAIHWKPADRLGRRPNPCPAADPLPELPSQRGRQQDQRDPGRARHADARPRRHRSRGRRRPAAARRDAPARRGLRDRGAFRADAERARRRCRPSTCACSTAAPRPGSASTVPASARASSRPSSPWCRTARRCRPARCRAEQRERDLGWMLHDIDFGEDGAAPPASSAPRCAAAYWT